MSERITVKKVMAGMREAEKVLKEGRKVAELLSPTTRKKTVRVRDDKFASELRRVKLAMGSQAITLMGGSPEEALVGLLYLYEHVDEIELIDCLSGSANFFLKQAMAKYHGDVSEDKDKVKALGGKTKSE